MRLVRTFRLANVRFADAARANGDGAFVSFRAEVAPRAARAIQRRSDRAMGPPAAQVPREQCFGPKSDEISHLKSYRTSERSSGGSANAPNPTLWAAARAPRATVPGRSGFLDSENPEVFRPWWGLGSRGSPPTTVPAATRTARRCGALRSAPGLCEAMRRSADPSEKSGLSN